MTAEATRPAIDPSRLEAFVGKVVGDAGGAFSVILAFIGDQLGLYKALAAGCPLTSAELALRTGTTERYVREWLIHQAAAGYVEYDPLCGAYYLTPEQAEALADESSPFCMAGAFQVVTAMVKAEPRIRESFRTGGGMAWGDHDHHLFEGTERFFRGGYQAYLIQSWIPALDGIRERLDAGARVADVGCGHGASTLIMAEAFPNSEFTGFDLHQPSIERARAAAERRGLSDRVRFEVADSGAITGSGYDLICFFDCFHDLADPISAARRAHEALGPEGTLLIVEPMAGETVEGNFTPVGRVFSGASVMCCTPNAIAGGGPALGAVAADSALRAAVEAGGFRRFHRATETPFNRVFEARK